MSLINEIATKCKPNYTYYEHYESDAEEIASILSIVSGDLARVHELAPKLNVEFALQLVGAYEIILREGSTIPDKTPYDILSEDVLPHLDTMEIKEEYDADGFETGDLTGEAQAEIS